MTHHSHNIIKSLACLRSYNSSLSASVSILKVFTWLLRLFKWPRQDTVAPTCLTSLSRSNGPEQPHCVPRFRQNHWDLWVGKSWSQCAGHSTDTPVTWSSSSFLFLPKFSPSFWGFLYNSHDEILNKKKICYLNHSVLVFIF